MTAAALAACAVIALRPATPADCERVWRWNAAREVRAMSRSAREIPLGEHRRWYARRLADAGSRIWIVEEDGAPVGVVRLEHDPGIRDRIALISIALEPRARGRGVGRRAIAAACAAWGGPIFAEIHDANRASRRSFEACGFAAMGGDGAFTTYLWMPAPRPLPPGAQMATDPADSIDPMHDTAQLALWRSEFGRDYTDRNDRERPERIGAWRRLLDGIAPARVLEVGCNVGWNLEYLRRLGVPQLYGVEPQAYAVERARARGPAFGVLQGTAFDLPFRDGWFDLAFTSGVLIHISPETIGAALGELHRVSRRWIAAIEYDHPTEQEVSYRGHAGALWKRDHGALWLALHPGLRRVLRLELGAADGYDDCTAHLFERVA